MTGKVLSTKALNRSLLARQFLLRRSRAGLNRVVDGMGGIQAQYAPSSYIGLWSRIDGFQRQHLTRALERGGLLQGTLMRVTIHIVTAKDYPLLTEAIRLSRRAWWQRVSRERRLDGHEMASAADVVRRALAGGPLTRKELIETLSEEGYPKDVWEGVGLWVDMIRVPPSGTWERRRADIYGLAPEPTSPVTEGAGLTHLVARYLGGFGPATVGGLSSWSGVPITTLEPVLESLRLRRFSSETGEELIDLPRRPLPDPATPAPVRFLPTWDAVLLTHARRTQILPEEYRSAIFSTKNPQSLTTFLVDGSVAGVWRQEGPRVVLEPFAPIPRKSRRDLEEESARLAAFLA